MIYKFRMLSSEDQNFLREYEVDSNQNFVDFHTAIQKNLKYDPSQLASFFITDEAWNKGLELTLIDMENDAGPAAIPMESVRIKDVVKRLKERLLYVYDIFSDKALFLELVDLHPPVPGFIYPLCSASAGAAPEQFSPLALDGLLNGGTDSSLSEFSTDEFEFDSDGFSLEEED